ncbi:hypothetical protein [Duffyella gerundensis]|uniref:hypothetical protein n=1 Tax=Duffyella gerundensis TaxID=1619313 RepID=UPI001654B159|nr:hypothetical protein [Duffyella gerundensis]
MDNIFRYLEAVPHHLGVENKRYGYGFTALILDMKSAEFVFGMLSSRDGAQGMQAFLCENPLFPSAQGETPAAALALLNTKLGQLYDFTESDGVYRWSAKEKFELRANCDQEEGDVISLYPVQWSDIVSDLEVAYEEHGDGFYEHALTNSSLSLMRDFHALRHFSYQDALKELNPA